MPSALVVHAGAWSITASERAAHGEGARRAAQAGWEVLEGGGTAREAVVTAVQVMEDDPALNAGRGSVLAADGTVRLDAAVMDGRDLEVGAVAAVTDLANPVRAADAVLGSDSVLLVAGDASAFARERGRRPCAPRDLIVPREVERLAAWKAGAGATDPADTVGAVAVDASGGLAAATSTGGRPGKRVGRLGDAPVPGAGLYADVRAGAACCSGWGEEVLRFGLARHTVDLAREATAQDACWLAVKAFEARVRGRGGVVAVRPDGGLGWAFDTPAFAVAWVDRDVGAPRVAGV